MQKESSIIISSAIQGLTADNVAFLDCAGKILVAHSVRKITPPTKIEAATGEWIYDNLDAEPMAVGLSTYTITATNSIKFKGGLLGAHEVMSIIVTGAVNVGDAIYYCVPDNPMDPYCDASGLLGYSWIIGRALSSVTNGGTVSVETCVPVKL